jgi:hypothetical protein
MPHRWESSTRSAVGPLAREGTGDFVCLAHSKLRYTQAHMIYYVGSSSSSVVSSHIRKNKRRLVHFVYTEGISCCGLK